MRRATTFFLIISFIALGLVIGGAFAVRWSCAQLPTQKICKVISPTEPSTISSTRPSTPVAPPVTNHWYSSLFFKDWGENIVMLPGWIKLKPQGIDIGAATPTFGPKAVISSLAPLFVVTPSDGQQFAKQEVVEAGEWHVGVNLTHANSGNTFVYLQKGMPTVHLETTGAALEITANPGQSFAVPFTETAPQQWVFRPNGASPWYLVELIGDTQQGPAELTEQRLRFPAQGRVAITQLPDEFSLVTPPTTAALAELSQCHRPRPLGTRLEINANQPTEIEYALVTETETASRHSPLPVLMTVWPHHRLASQLKQLGTYASPRGELSLVCAASLPLVLSTPEVSEEYLTTAQWATFSPARQTELRTMLRADWQTLAKITPPPGVYFRGKHLKMMVDVWVLAKIIDPPLATEIASVLGPLIEQDLTKFRFDEQKQKTFFQPTEFGHEFGNDHHFQYGYWIYVLSRWHEQASGEQKPRVAALLRQLVNEGIPFPSAVKKQTTDPSSQNDERHQLRQFGYFDAYEGHSWADGRGTFADGNNQESTSEALQYWASVLWWAKHVEPNEKVAQSARFGLWSEVSSRDAYWLMANNPYLRSRSQVPIYSMVFGAKADYATWFSAEDDKIIGIQFLPLFPASREVYKITDEPARTRLISLLEKDFSARSQASFAPYLQAVVNINGRPMPYGPIHPNEYLPSVVLHLMGEPQP